MPAAVKALILQAICLISGAVLAAITGLSLLYSALYVLSFLVPAYVLAGEERFNEIGFGAAYLAIWLAARPGVDCALGGSVTGACVGGGIYEAFGPRIALVTYPQFFEGFGNVVDFLVNALPYVMAKTFQGAFGVNWATVVAALAGTFLLHATVALVGMESLRRSLEP